MVSANDGSGRIFQPDPYFVVGRLLYLPVPRHCGGPVSACPAGQGSEFDCAGSAERTITAETEPGWTGSAAISQEATARAASYSLQLWPGPTPGRVTAAGNGAKKPVKSPLTITNLRTDLI